MACADTIINGTSFAAMLVARPAPLASPFPGRAVPVAWPVDVNRGGWSPGDGGDRQIADGVPTGTIRRTRVGDGRAVMNVGVARLLPRVCEAGSPGDPCTAVALVDSRRGARSVGDVDGDTMSCL